MAKKTKLELTWIGKDQRPRLEPRVLLEDPTKSYHAPHKVTENDQFDNRLIFGDNLLALKALEQEFAGKIKCVFIDPPYNTGSAFEHYDDGVEHSLWLTLIRHRLEIIWRLLTNDGSLWITIDDNECHYLKVLCDEIFGRACFVASMVWEKEGGRKNDTDISTSHDYVLLYAKDRKVWKDSRNLLDRTADQDKRYQNPDKDPRGPWRQGADGTAKSGSDKLRFTITLPSGRSVKPPTGNFWRFSEETFKKALKENRVYFGKQGDGLPVIKKYLSDIRDGIVPRTWWPYKEVGSNQEARRDHLRKLLPDIEPFATPKPERLLYRIIKIATDPGDWVLDSFAGSGTTGAVAHKMGRKWILVELGEHCHSHLIPRLKKVIEGKDHGGISSDRKLVWETKLSLTKLKKLAQDSPGNSEDALSEMANAEEEHADFYERFERKFEDDHLRLYGIETEDDRPFGGGFRYFTIAPSLLEQDEFGNWIISKQYNATMLARAICKIEGFTYAPSESVYWQQGHSTETDFIYVTTQNLTRQQIEALSEEVGPNRSLSVMCSAYRIRKVDDFPNLTLKKIPKTVLNKCEWGKDDYSLEIQELPPAPEEVSDEPPPPRRRKPRNDDGQPKLFAMEGEQ